MTGDQLFTLAVITLLFAVLILFAILHDQTLAKQDKADRKSHNDLMQEIDRHETKRK